MNALVDTHVVLWFAMGDTRLPVRHRTLLQARNQKLYFSSISAAEISIKYLRGTLRLPRPPLDLIPQIISELGLQPLPLTLSHGLAISQLPLHHSDPFDRLLIAQAMHEDLPIVTVDKDIRKYDVKIVW